MSAGASVASALRKLSPLTLWIAVLAGLTSALVVLFLKTPRGIVGYDFLAFWCGARAVLAGANPYVTAPLHACEVANAPALFLNFPNLTVPAPLPPYALALFGPLSYLPFVVARALWWLLLVACVLMEARLIQRLTKRSYAFGFAACGLALTGPVIVQGALAPLPIVLLTAGALALQNARWWRGSALVAAAMIEPHMALPAALAVFFFLPRTRLPLATFGFVAGALAFLAVGPQIFVSYFTAVLPVHALSELDNLGQDSLTALLHHLGVADALALHAGSAQYAFVVVLAIVVAGRLARREHDTAWLVLLPAAFAMIGGEFVHLSEIAMAIPLAAVLAVRKGGSAWFALAFLAVPGEAAINDSIFALPAALFTALLLREVRVPTLRVVAATVVVAGFALIAHVFAVQQVGVALHALADPGDASLSSISWGEWNRLSYIGPAWWIQKAFTLVPLVLLAWATLDYARSPRPAELPTRRSSAAPLASI